MALNMNNSTIIYCKIPPTLLRRSFQQKFSKVAAKFALPPIVLQRYEDTDSVSNLQAESDI